MTGQIRERSYHAGVDPLDPARLGFRPLTQEDLPLLQRWLNTPHVVEWWDQPGPTLEQVVAEYGPCVTGEEPTRCYIIRYGARPIGMVQLYRIGDYPEHSAQMPVEPDAAGLDLFIGEKDHVHRGLGPHILRRFLDELVFPEYAACAIDPAERNRSAIRAYKKAGFRYVATIIDRETGERESIMRADRPAMKAVSD